MRKATTFYLSLCLTVFIVSCAESDKEATGTVVSVDEISGDWSRYQEDSELPAHVPGQLVVASNDGSIASIPFVQKMTKEAQGEVQKIHSFSYPSGETRTIAVLNLRSLSVLSALRKIGAVPGKRVEPNFIYKLNAYTNANDYYMDKARLFNGTTTTALWGVHQTLTQPMWAKATGKDIVVAVVDTGIGVHNDLDANVYVNPKEIAGNGMDDDNNGRVDDVRGFNFVNNTNNAIDDNGHGTHVGGTIAARCDNAIGICGVAPDAKLLAVKTLNAAGQGTLEGVAAGVNYAASFAVVKVINMSVGGPASTILDDSVRAAVAKGIVVAVAAGNGDANGVPVNTNGESPARVTQAITVGASTPANQIASFSNFGAEVDVVAPGTMILSTLANGTTLPNIVTEPTGNRYAVIQGTSMATPHVAGLAALIRSGNPKLTPAEVETIIKQNATDLLTPGRDDMSGNGLIEVTKTVNAALAIGNLAPNFIAKNEASVTANELLEFVIDVKDPEGLTVNVTAEGLPEGAVFDAAGKKFSWKPTQAQSNKSYDVKFVASDGIASSEMSTKISVLPASSGSDEAVDQSESSSNAPGVKSLSCSAKGSDRGTVLGFFLLFLLVLKLTRKKASF